MEPEKQAYPEGAAPPAYTAPSAYPQGYQQPPTSYPQQPPTSYPPSSYAQQPYYQPTTTYGQQSTVIVSQPAGYAVTNQVMVAPPNHMALAWLTCLFCFWPLGIAAIIKANEVDAATSRGDLASANAASRSARTLSMIGIGLGIGAYILIVVIVVINATAAASAYNTNYYG